MNRNTFVLASLVAIGIVASGTAETMPVLPDTTGVDADSLEPPPPDTLHVWTEPGAWHLRWWSIELPAIFEGNLVVRGPGTIDSVHWVDVDSTDIRIEAGDRRLRFRSAADSTARGIDIYSSAPRLSIGITINGAEPESLSSMLIGPDGTRNPPGFPFSVNGSRLVAKGQAEQDSTLEILTHDQAWAGMPPPSPPPGGCVLWLDERGWRLDWAAETPVSGRVAVTGPTFGSPDTLELTRAIPPVRIATEADSLWIEIDGDSTSLEIGADRLRPSRPRILLVPSP